MIKLNVGNELGLHARVAARIAATLQQFDSHVMLCKDDAQADGDSVLSILALDAPQGSTLIASASGPQAREALQALEKLFSSNFGEI